VIEKAFCKPEGEVRESKKKGVETGAQRLSYMRPEAALFKLPKRINSETLDFCKDKIC